jgi:predicted dehydrogenase
MRKLNVGVIGVGGHGRSRHLLPLKELSSVQLVAVADVDKKRAERIGDEFRVRAYTDYHNMLDKEDLDAVHVVTPTGLHSRIATDCLNHGLHVLVDKPLGANLAEVLQVVKAAKRNHKTLMVGYWSRFSPALQFGLEAAESGGLGTVYYSYGYLVRRRGIPGTATFIDKELSGGRGALLDIGCYILDNLLAVLHFPRPLSASGASYSVFGKKTDEVKFNWGSWNTSKFDLDDFSVGFVRFEDGSTMTVEVGWAANVSHSEETSKMIVLGDKGGIEGVGAEQINSVTLHSRTSGFLTNTQPLLKQVNTAHVMVEHFVESVESGRAPQVTGEQSIILQAIVDAVYSSSQRKEEVKIELPEI